MDVHRVRRGVLVKYAVALPEQRTWIIPGQQNGEAQNVHYYHDENDKL